MSILFHKFRTVHKTMKVEDRKSFGHGWWSSLLQPTIRERHHIPLQAETIKSPPATLRLSAIVESTSPAPLDSPTMTMAHGNSTTTTTTTTTTQPRMGELQENNESSLISENGRRFTPQCSTPLVWPWTRSTYQRHAQRHHCLQYQTKATNADQLLSE